MLNMKVGTYHNGFLLVFDLLALGKVAYAGTWNKNMLNTQQSNSTQNIPVNIFKTLL